jgi:hypothetical protein
MSEERRRLQAAFDAGIESVRDETASLSLDQGRSARTTLNSWWYQEVCPYCHHTIRVGDTVRRLLGGSIVHDDPRLPCPSARQTLEVPPEVSITPSGDAHACAASEARAFFDGLEREWAPARGIVLTLLVKGHPLLSPPFAGFRRRRCVGCDHTFRPLDLVVICPCNPARPLCQAAIHRDPAHNLSCFEMWSPSGTRTHCPITSRELGAEP